MFSSMTFFGITHESNRESEETEEKEESEKTKEKEESDMTEDMMHAK